MVAVIGGEETYGRVKSVDGTPVVTQFLMLSLIPLWPVRSFYLSRLGKTEFTGIPFVAYQTKREIIGVQLERLSSISVAMSYVRGFLGTIFVLGLILTFARFMTGEAPRGVPPWVENAIYSITAGAALFGGMSYLVPLTSHREKMIRHYCGVVLDIAIDPAMIQPEIAKSILVELPETWTRCSSASTSDADRQELKTICKLIQTRCKLAGKRSVKLESRSDELIESINPENLF